MKLRVVERDLVLFWTYTFFFMNKSKIIKKLKKNQASITEIGHIRNILDSMSKI